MRQFCEVCGETRCARVDASCRVPCVSHALRHVHDVHNGPAYLAECAQQREAAMARTIYGSSQRAGHVAHSMTEHLWDCGTQFECECGWLSPFAPSKLGLLESAVAEHKAGIRHGLEMTEQTANRCGFERRGPPRYSWVEVREPWLPMDDQPAIQADMRSKGLDPDGPLMPLPAPQANAERVFAAPAHDYLAALYRSYVAPV